MNNKLLTLAAYDNPVLHQPTQLVSFPLSEEDKQIISDMVYSIQPKQLKAAKAPWTAAVGMAANQWGINKSIFLYCPYGDTVNGLEVIINPSYKQTIFTPQDQEWEGCFSVPLALGNMQRSTKIRVKYQNMAGETLEKELSDWEARVWQHENDHLNGYLYDDDRPGKGKCIEKRIFANIKDAEQFCNEMRDGPKEPKKELLK